MAGVLELWRWIIEFELKPLFVSLSLQQTELLFQSD